MSRQEREPGAPPPRRDGQRREQTEEPFGEYRERWKRAIRAYWKTVPFNSIVEAGAPSYAHRSRLISWFFWERVHHVVRFLRRIDHVGRALDLGCGLGVLLPELVSLSPEVHAVDPNLEPAKSLRRTMGFEQAGLHTSLAEYMAADPRPFDTILALDVLEHMPDLDDRLLELDAVTAPGGRLILSGPTENWLYKLGRAAAGFRRIYESHEDSGGGRLDVSAGANPHHHFTIYDIERKLRQSGRQVRVIKTLYPPVPVFRLLEARKV